MESLAGLLNTIGCGFAKFLEREAGHTLTAIMMIVISIRISDPQTRAAGAHDLMIYALGMLSKGMGNGSQTVK